jgi:hypothetical protein
MLFPKGNLNFWSVVLPIVYFHNQRISDDDKSNGSIGYSSSYNKLNNDEFTGW